MPTRVNRRAAIGLAMILAGSAGCVTVSPDQLAGKSRLEGGAIPSASALEALIRVEVEPIEGPLAAVAAAEPRR